MIARDALERRSPYQRLRRRQRQRRQAGTANGRSSDLEVEYGGGGGVEVLDIAQIGALFSPSWGHNAVPAEKQCVERTFWLLSTSRMTTIRRDGELEGGWNVALIGIFRKARAMVERIGVRASLSGDVAGFRELIESVGWRLGLLRARKEEI